MKTLLVFSPKGGSGKSTIARNLAAAAAQSGVSTATLDTDPQGTLTKWWQNRPGEAPAIDHYQQALSEFTEPPESVDGAALLIVDTPTAVETSDYSGPAGVMIKAADLILVPLQATPEDLESAIGATGLIRGLGKEPVFVLNRVQPRVKEVTDARRDLSGGGDVAPVDIPQLAEVYRTFPIGLGVVELKGARSAEDFAALWRYVAGKLGL